jgi:hypothetical protein
LVPERGSFTFCEFSSKAEEQELTNRYVEDEKYSKKEINDILGYGSEINMRNIGVLRKQISPYFDLEDVISKLNQGTAFEMKLNPCRG